MASLHVSSFQSGSEMLTTGCVIDFVCPKSATIQHEAFVRNNAEDDDDWAKVKMTVSNFPDVVDE